MVATLARRLTGALLLALVFSMPVALAVCSAEMVVGAPPAVAEAEPVLAPLAVADAR